MSSHPDVSALVTAALDHGLTPEEVCADFPGLASDVRREFERCKQIDSDLEALFPTSASGSKDLDPRVHVSAELPIIPGYELDSILGRGGMGIVYRAKQVNLNRTVAIKMLLAGAYASPAELARFVREAGVVAGLHHPHIVQVHELGDFEGRPYFTMEYVEGGSLSRLLSGTPMQSRAAAQQMVTLAAALQAAHEAGVVHCDLKPANILLAVDGSAKISDFGLAYRFQSQPVEGRAGKRVGTPSYMAPEQTASGNGVIGPAADIYALGAILYEMLTGRPPFRGESVAETERQLLEDEPVSPSRLNGRVPPDLETICLKCLSKSPSRRYLTAAALSADLGRFLRAEPVQARPVGPSERALKWVRRRPATATAITSAVMFATLLFIGTSWMFAQRTSTVRAVKEDLIDAIRAQRVSDWTTADAALGRATFH